MRPDVIILDMLMPEGEGNYIFGRLKMHPLTGKVPVLVLTGNNTVAMRRKMFGLGVDGFLSKPIDFQLLLEHLRQYITIKEPRPQAQPESDQEPGWAQLLGRGRVRQTAKQPE
jgi:CheY-like chemotaxis protein